MPDSLEIKRKRAKAKLKLQASTVSLTEEVPSPQQEQPSTFEPLLQEAMGKAGEVAGEIGQVIQQPEAVPSVFMQQHPATFGATGAGLETIKSVGRFSKNFPKDIKDVAVGTLNMLKHPVQTATSISALANGVVSKMLPDNPSPENEKLVDGLIKSFSDKYGSLEQLKTTFETKPAEFMSDVGMVMNLAGGATRLTGMAGTKIVPPSGKGSKFFKQLTTTGEAITKAGQKFEPLTALGKVASGVRKSLPAQTAANLLYRRAIRLKKMAPSMKKRLTKAGLDAAILPSRRGLDKLWDNIMALDGEFEKRVIPASARGETIRTTQLFKHLDDLETSLALDPQANTLIKELKQMKQVFVKSHGKTIDLKKAQDMKKAIHKKLKKNWDKSGELVTQFNQGIAEGIREELISKYPELRAVGLKEGDLIGLVPEIEAAIHRLDGRKILGLKDEFAGLVTGLATSSPGVGIAVGVTSAVLTHPRLQARIATMINTARNMKVPDRGAFLRLMAEQTAMATEDVEPQGKAPDIMEMLSSAFGKSMARQTGLAKPVEKREPRLTNALKNFNIANQ